MNICTKYGFDILIISGSYGGHRRTTYDEQRTTPRVWHKLPTGELKRLFEKNTDAVLFSRTGLYTVHYHLPNTKHLHYLNSLKHGNI